MLLLMLLSWAVLTGGLLCLLLLVIGAQAARRVLRRAGAGVRRTADVGHRTPAEG